MRTRDVILKKLEENRDKFLSGEALATELNLSRTAIWKAVNTLKNEGYKIQSATNRGYRIDETCDKLSKYGVLASVRPELRDIDVRVYDSIESTNTEAKKLLYTEELSNFTVLVADEQTGGRGRTGKNFSSPKGSGIYFSIIIFPEGKFDFSAFDIITVRAAVAVLNAIKNKTDKSPKIKWVNDLFLNHRKICGILSEADTDFESREIKSIIIGIGINFNTSENEFSDELKYIAGSLNPDGNLHRNELLGEILNEFYRCTYDLSDEEILKIYRDNSILLGRNVTFKKNDNIYEAKAVDINDKGNLIVELTDGEEMTLYSGEVSVKGDI